MVMESSKWWCIGNHKTANHSRIYLRVAGRQLQEKPTGQVILIRLFSCAPTSATTVMFVLSEMYSQTENQANTKLNNDYIEIELALQVLQNLERIINGVSHLPLHMSDLISR
ncbi:Uncharacterized protein Rs2_49853 [Raphanus sativus]|nr:Uncharacterized protein Rs2_49853 [Raphanus sativus]